MKCFVALLVLVTLAVVSAKVGKFAKQNLHNYRVESQQLHIKKLVKEVEELEEEYEKLSPIPDAETIAHVKARVRNLEGDHCNDDSEVQCGGDEPQCISKLFVCDGRQDCKNNRDEDDDTCSDEPYRVGTTLSGITSWTDCFNHLPHMTIITITANEKEEAYTNKVYLKAVVSFEVDEHSHLVQSISAKGYWNAGTRALVLVPDRPDDEKSTFGHAVVCKFILGTNHEAECKIGTIASRHVCATFRGGRH